jgi:hypothetical protein
MKTLALAVALTLPAGLSLAAPMSELVTTRENHDIYQQFGRDSVYAIETRQPADTGPRYSSDGSSGVGGVFAGIGAAGASAWNRVTGLFDSDGSTHAATPPEPEMYGRAGGYVGTDQLALLERAGTAPATNEVVTTRESLAATESPDVRYPAATEDQLYGSEQRYHGSEERFERSDEHVEAAAPATDQSAPAIEDDVTWSSEVEQRAPSPEVGAVEDQAEVEGMTAAPADGDDWQQGDVKQRDETEVTSDGDVTRDGRG